MFPPVDHFDIKPITDFLGQPYWNGVAAIAAIIAVWPQRKQKRSLPQLPSSQSQSPVIVSTHSTKLVVPTQAKEQLQDRDSDPYDPCCPSRLLDFGGLWLY